jgi:DNA-binding SARP family transcriptional activator
MPTASKRVAGRTTAVLPQWVVPAVSLAGLVFGIPVALVAFHVTPPFVQLGHAIDHPGDFTHYLAGAVTASAVAKGIACAAWVVWLWLVTCVTAEAVAIIRGHPPLHLPASRHVQAVLSTLVGASLAVVPLGRDVLPMRLQTAPAAVHRAMGPEAGVNGDSSTDLLARDAAVTFPRSPTATPVVATEVVTTTPYTVKPGDTLWSIAKHELGSPLQWRAIAELNYGRVQSDGEALTDARWIFPGWVLDLPAPPPLAGSSALVQRWTAPTADDVVPQPTVRDTRPWPGPSQLVSENGPIGVNNGSAAHQPTPAASPEKEAPATGHARSPLPLGMISYGILGAGVIALLDRLRRVQQRHRPNGLRIALPDLDLATLECRLRTDADPDAVQFIDLGLRALVTRSLGQDRIPPPATIMRLQEHALEIVLDVEAAGGIPPAPFTADGLGSWSLSRDHTTISALRADADSTLGDAPYPALVTIGRDGSGLVLIDLEQAGSVAVTGPEANTVLGTMAAELATAAWADQVDLILVGFDGELEELERVHHVPFIADIASKVQRRVRERTALLTSVGHHANWEIRWAEGGDAWDMCVVVCAPPAVSVDPEGAAALVGLAGAGGLGVAVALGSATKGVRWHLAAHDGRIDVTAPGRETSTLLSPSMGDVDPTAVGALVKIAGHRDGVAPSAPPYDQVVDTLPAPAADEVGPPMGRPEPDRGDPFATSSTEPDDDAPEVEVRVLGAVEIVGAARPFTRAWAVELIVYLAMHRRGASSEQWATALWPDRIMAAASLHSTASAARRSLGVARSGDDHLPRAHGRLALGASVKSDWNRFVELSERPEPDNWRRALELIRGRPFDGLRAPDWVLLEGIAANVEAVIVDVASRYAEQCLASGHPDMAEWCARQGLQASAYDERLYRILLRAADAAGNPAGVESVMAELVHLVAEDVEPYDAVHPETLDLYRSLSRRSTPAPTR